MAAQSNNGETQEAKKLRSVHDAPPPVYGSLEELAQGSAANQARYETLKAAFEAKYGGSPKFVCRAPGRVNLIGEHVDYSGYGVLPMAIEQDIAIACRPNASSGLLSFANVSPDTYPDHACPVSGFEIDRKSIVWHSYILCGIKGMVEEFGIKEPTGIDMMVSGSIPPASGLSSSSALVCCAALATLSTNGVEPRSKRELAEMCARCERFIGTQGGGMDQAISFLGQPVKAMMIEFNPVRPTEVRLPAGYTFVISNTNVSSNKAAASYFNTRVAEVHLAARVVAVVRKGRDGGSVDWRGVRRLMTLAKDVLDLPLSEMSAVVTECLHPGAYSREEVCAILEVTDEEFAKECLTEKSADVTTFKLLDRAKHVFEEANRVYEFKKTANSTVSDSDSNDGSCNINDNVAEKLGELMDDSHRSCSVLYECSCPELDRLVGLCKESGALGSRLTGAGWGGCAVSLVRDGDVESFMEKLKEGFYNNSSSSSSSNTGNISNSLFATQPGGGAAVCKFED